MRARTRFRLSHVTGIRGQQFQSRGSEAREGQTHQATAAMVPRQPPNSVICRLGGCSFRLTISARPSFSGVQRFQAHIRHANEAFAGLRAGIRLERPDEGVESSPELDG